MYKSKQYIPFSQRLVRGAIGKKYVIKHYKYGIVKTKFPDMTMIVASDKQQACRDKFKALNAIVKLIYRDPVQREQWRQKLRNPPHLYAAIIKAYGKEMEEAKVKRMLATNRLIRKSFLREVPAICLNGDLSGREGCTICSLGFTLDGQEGDSPGPKRKNRQEINTE